MQIIAVIFIVLAVLICITLFVRSRAREGVGVFELTDKDRTDLRDVRRELGVRRILARLLGGFGGILFIAGASSPLYRESAGRVDWSTAAWMIIVGLILAFCAMLLVKQSR